MFTPDYFDSLASEMIPVRLAARSFIIPIPAGIGQLMVYPEDVTGDPSRKAGMPIVNGKGEPKGNGIVFRNYTDNAVQAVRSNGKEMIIVNGLSRAEAKQLAAEYDRLIPAPAAATEGQIRKVLAFAHDKLKIDDFYNGDRAKIPGFEVEDAHPDDPDCGTFIRRSPEERFALLGVGAGTYKGPASTPQVFHDHVAVIRNEKHAWMVDTYALLKTYRHPDDREIKITDLPAFDIKEQLPPVKNIWGFMSDAGRFKPAIGRPS